MLVRKVFAQLQGLQDSFKLQATQCLQSLITWSLPPEATLDPSGLQSTQNTCRVTFCMQLSCVCQDLSTNTQGKNFHGCIPLVCGGYTKHPHTWARSLNTWSAKEDSGVMIRQQFPSLCAALHAQIMQHNARPKGLACLLACLLACSLVC